MTPQQPRLSTELRRRTRQKREGAALLIVMFILMMSTGTAIYAMQSTQYEQRAAGSLVQATRTKYVAEAATVGVLASCYQGGASGCVDLKLSPDNFSSSRSKYALPAYGGREEVYQVGPSDLTNSSFVGSVVATDSDVLGTSGTATAFQPSFTTVMEKWEVPNPGETRQRYRLIVSTYGELGIGSLESELAAGEFRGGHESVSATRAFFDVRE